MPKMKTKKALKGRFKTTATGKVMRQKKGRRHILTKKPAKKKLKLRQQTTTPEAYAHLYKRLMGTA